MLCADALRFEMADSGIWVLADIVCHRRRGKGDSRKRLR
jgi:hypothetical protein